MHANLRKPQLRVLTFLLVLAVVFTFTPLLPQSEVNAAENDSLLTVKLTGETAKLVGAKATWEKTYYEPGDLYDEDGDGVSDGYLNDGYLNTVLGYNEFDYPIYHPELLGTEKPQVSWFDYNGNGRPDIDTVKNDSNEFRDEFVVNWIAHYDKATLSIWNSKTDTFFEDATLTESIQDEAAEEAAKALAKSQLATALRVKENALTAANKVANEATSGPLLDAREARDKAYKAAKQVRDDAKEAYEAAYNTATKPALKIKNDAEYAADKVYTAAEIAADAAFKEATRPAEVAKRTAYDNADVVYIAAEQAANKAYEEAEKTADDALKAALADQENAFKNAVRAPRTAYDDALKRFNEDENRKNALSDATDTRNKLLNDAGAVQTEADNKAEDAYDEAESAAATARDNEITSAGIAYKEAYDKAYETYNIAWNQAGDDKALQERAKRDLSAALDDAQYAKKTREKAARDVYDAAEAEAEKVKNDALDAAQDVYDAAEKVAKDAFRTVLRESGDAGKIYDDMVKPDKDAYDRAVKNAFNQLLKPLYDAYNAVVGPEDKSFRFELENYVYITVFYNGYQSDIRYYYEYREDKPYSYYESDRSHHIGKVGSATKAKDNAIERAEQDRTAARDAADKVYGRATDPEAKRRAAAILKAKSVKDAACKIAEKAFNAAIRPAKKTKEDAEKAATKAYNAAIKAADDAFYQVLTAAGLYDRATIDAAIATATAAYKSALEKLYVKPAFEFRIDSKYSGKTATIQYENSAATKANYGSYASQVIGGYFGDLNYASYENGKQFKTFKLTFKTGKKAVTYPLAKAVLQTVKVTPKDTPLAYEKNYHKDIDGDEDLPGVPTGRITGIQYYEDFDDTTPEPDPDPETGQLVPTKWKETGVEGFVITKNDASSADYENVNWLNIVTEKYDPGKKQYVQTWEYSNEYLGTYVFPALPGTTMIFKASGQFSDASTYSTGDYKPEKDYQTMWLGGYKSSDIEGNPATVKKITVGKKNKTVGTIKLTAAKGKITGTIGDTNKVVPVAIGVGKDSVERYADVEVNPLLDGTDWQSATQTEFFNYIEDKSKVAVESHETYSTAADADKVPVTPDTEKLQWETATEAEYLAYIAGDAAVPAETYLTDENEKRCAVKTGIPYVARLKLDEDDDTGEKIFDGFEKAVIKDNSDHDKWVPASKDEYVAYLSAKGTGGEDWFGTEVHAYPYVVKTDKEYNPTQKGLEVSRDQYYAAKDAGYQVYTDEDKDKVLRYYQYDSTEITRDEYKTFPNALWVYESDALFLNAGQWEPKYFRINSFGNLTKVADKAAYDALPDDLKAEEYNYFDKATGITSYFAKNNNYLKATPVYYYTKVSKTYVIDGLQAGVYAVSIDGQAKVVTLKAGKSVKASFKDPKTINDPKNLPTITTKVTGKRTKGKKLTASSDVISAKFGAVAPKYSYFWTDGTKILSKKAAYKQTKKTAKKNLFVLTIATTGKYQTLVKSSDGPWLSAPGNKYGKVGFSVTVTQAKNKFKKGQKVKATIGGEQVTGVKYTYQWLRNGKAIKGKSAKKATYKLTKKDKGKKISVKVTGTKAGYTTVTVTSAKTVKIK